MTAGREPSPRGKQAAADRKARAPAARIACFSAMLLTRYPSFPVLVLRNHCDADGFIPGVVRHEFYVQVREDFRNHPVAQLGNQRFAHVVAEQRRGSADEQCARVIERDHVGAGVPRKEPSRNSVERASRSSPSRLMDSLKSEPSPAVEPRLWRVE